MIGKFKFFILLLAIALAGLGAWYRLTQKPEAAAIKFAEELASRSDVIAAITRQNSAPLQDIKSLDAQWRQQRLHPLPGSLVDRLMASTLSKRLATLRINSGGQIVQVMVMDKRGALVAADHITHDYDQSDEPKWQRTVGMANPAPVLEWQQRSANAELYQVSKTVVDLQGQIIGAITLVWCSTGGGCKAL